MPAGRSGTHSIGVGSGRAKKPAVFSGLDMLAVSEEWAARVEEEEERIGHARKHWARFAGLRDQETAFSMISHDGGIG
jgi:hypothetical protein